MELGGGASVEGEPGSGTTPGLGAGDPRPALQKGPAHSRSLIEAARGPSEGPWEWLSGGWSSHGVQAQGSPAFEQGRRGWGSWGPLTPSQGLPCTQPPSGAPHGHTCVPPGALSFHLFSVHLCLCPFTSLPHHPALDCPLPPRWAPLHLSTGGPSRSGPRDLRSPRFASQGRVRGRGAVWPWLVPCPLRTMVPHYSPLGWEGWTVPKVWDIGS